MTTITQVISTAPIAPSWQRPDDFPEEADTFVLYLSGLDTELNTAFGQVNTVAGEINTISTTTIPALVEDAEGQVVLAAGQVALAAEQVALAAGQVVLAAGQVALAAEQVALAQTAKTASETARDLSLAYSQSVATLVEGTINDSIADTDMTYSSNFILNNLCKKSFSL